MGVRLPQFLAAVLIPTVAYIHLILIPPFSISSPLQFLNVFLSHLNRLLTLILLEPLALTNMMVLNDMKGSFLFLSPLIVLGIFGVYAVITIVYRVANFKTFPDAGIKLAADVKRARADLKKKGVKGF